MSKMPSEGKKEAAPSRKPARGRRGGRRIAKRLEEAKKAEEKARKDADGKDYVRVLEEDKKALDRLPSDLFIHVRRLLDQGAAPFPRSTLGVSKLNVFL